MSTKHLIPIQIEEETYSRTVFGFWIYLLTDCLLFATLFCTYGVLYTQVANGPSGQDIFNPKTVFLETMILLVSSFCCGLALLKAIENKKNKLLLYLSITLFLGITFVVLEFLEFRHLIIEGSSYQKSAFLSSYFTLVGTHGLHVTFGSIWLCTLIFQLIFTGLTVETFRRLVLFNLFWHFLDLVWIFIFTCVYLLGVI